MNRPTQPVVFSDLDGSLLDHDTYEFEAARPAIEALRRAQVGGASNRLLSAWSDAYYWQAGRLLSDAPSADDVRRAFAVIERLRAQELREALELARRDFV